MAKTKILIVEDELIVSKDVESVLTGLGYNVVGVLASGEAAVEQADALQPDLILMDIKLKGEMTGIEAADLITEKMDVPVIFLTAYTDDSTIDKAKYTEPYGYIIKPFNEKELQTTIEMALYKHEKDLQVKKERDLYHSVIENRDSSDSIFIRSDYRLNRIRFDDIFFVEALKDYVVLHTRDNIFTTHAAMKEIADILPDKDFVRVHRSFIIRLDKIFSIKYPELVVEGKMKIIPIGGMYKKELFNRLNMV